MKWQNLNCIENFLPVGYIPISEKYLYAIVLLNREAWRHVFNFWIRYMDRGAMRLVNFAVNLCSRESWKLICVFFHKTYVQLLMCIDMIYYFLLTITQPHDNLQYLHLL